MGEVPGYHGPTWIALFVETTDGHPIACVDTDHVGMIQYAPGWRSADSLATEVERIVGAAAPRRKRIGDYYVGTVSMRRDGDSS